MNEAEYISYFRNLAIQSKDIGHTVSGLKKSFLVVDNPYDLTALDTAIRSTLKVPAMLLDIPQFTPTSNASASFTNTVDGVFMIIMKAGKNNLATVRDECLSIGLKVLYRMHYDYKHQAIEPGKPVYFQMDNTKVEPVGPIAVEYHGYMFSFSFICPFGFSVNGASWTDLEE